MQLITIGVGIVAFAGRRRGAYYLVGVGSRQRFFFPSCIIEISLTEGAEY